jgi:uncharacterized membrane protein
VAARAFPGRSLIVALALAGALASAWLEIVHYRAYMLPGDESLCALGGRFDCTSVALSQFSLWLGVPLPVWGFVGFSAIGVCAWQRSRWLLPLAFVAALTGVLLTTVSGWAIGAWCVICEATHVLSFAILALTWRARKALAQSYAFDDALVTGAPALGVLLAVRLFVPPYWGLTLGSTLPFAHGHTAEGDPWIGATEPTLTLEEFVDYTCPHCRAASALSLRRVAAHPRELRIVRRHWPRIPCQPASTTRCLPLRIALCADEQDRFWQADRWLFDHSRGGNVPELSAAASDLDLDAERLAACIGRPSTFERAALETKRAKARRLPGVPYYAQGDRIATSATASAWIDAL